MATKSVLQYVQACLSTMDSDEVDGIDETAEATQVANLLSDTYYELINRQEWEFLKGAITITGAGDLTFPTKFTVSDETRHIHNLWYNVGTSLDVQRRELRWIEPKEFLDRFGSGSLTDGKLLITLPTQIQFYVRTDRHPTYYTSFDDVTIFCDSYDSSVETTLVSSKVSGMGVSIPQFQVEDDFVPVLPEHMVPLLQSSLNAAAHLNFKQQQSAVDERRERRQLAQARSRNSKVADREHYYANSFGRR